MGVFGSSGVRGIVNEELTPTFVERLAAAAGSVLESDHVAIARDTRISGPMFVNAAAAGFMSVGVDVDRLGVLPTPGLQDYLQRTGRFGCMITASHNPREYNGVKLFDAGGRELAGDGLTNIEDAVEQHARQHVQWDHTGRQHDIDIAAQRYVEGIIDAVDAENISDAGLTVAIDPGHGASCETTPHMCRKLGCQVVSVNATPDGRFPGRSPEPVPAVLEDLQRLVRASDADLGVAHDGDGDRAMFVDETGAIVDGNTMLAVLATALLAEGDTVVTAVNTSQRVQDAVADVGGQVELTPIGSAQIIERVTACQNRGERVPLAGESNGGVFLPTARPARDGAFVLARVLSLICEEPLSSRAAEHTGYHLEKRVLQYDSPDERTEMLSAIESVADRTEATVDRTDGVRLDFGDGWVLARPSGTEPVIRVSAEARTRERAQDHLDTMLAAVTNR